MKCAIGCDLGTSALKLTLTDEKGNILKSIDKEYPLSFPQEGFSEQNPLDWVKATFDGIKEIVCNIDSIEILGIAFSGQMHGLVALDEKGEVIRPCILWNDSRSSIECEELNQNKELLIQETGNIAYPGFTLPKILWMKKHEPKLYQRIKHVLLPKDYINYVLTGNLYSDYSDAAGTLVLNVKERKWSQTMIQISGLNSSCFPSLIETGSVVGMVKEEIISKLGLKKSFPVYQGAADNAAAAIGNGVISDCECNISLGTSGTIFVASDDYTFDPNGAIHSFSSGTGSNCLLACMLSAASCLKWLNDSVFEIKDYNSVQKNITKDQLGHNDVFFLPYLMGERSPINDPNARGCFVGLTLNTKREDMTLAIMEGVAFALRDSFETIKNMGLEIKESYLTGGGCRSQLWKNILASVLNIKLKSFASSSGPSIGMAMAILVASGCFASLNEAKEELLHVSSVTESNEKLVSLYEEKYQKFKLIYPALKKYFSH